MRDPYDIFYALCAERPTGTLLVHRGATNPTTRLGAVMRDASGHRISVILTREQAAELALAINEWLMHGGSDGCGN